MLQLSSSGVRRLGLAALLAGSSCSAPDSSDLFGPASPASIRDEGSPGSMATGGAGGEPAIAMPTTSEPVPSAGLGGEGIEPIPGGVLSPPDPSVGSGEPVVPASDAGVSILDPDSGGAPGPTDPIEPTGPVEPGPPAPPQPAPSCAGNPLGGNCWYLGATSQSCDDVCSTRGGFSPASNAVVGTPSQGGSIEGCDAVLQAFGAPAGVVNEGFRDDGLGFGCHVFIDNEGTATAWWLTAPDTSPGIADPNVRMVCGCVR